MREFFKSILSFRAVLSIIIALAAIGVYIALRVCKDHLLKKRRETGARATIIAVSFSAVRVILLVVAILAILQINGINVTAIIAGLGIAGAIVGLAFQDYLKDIIMGINILTDHFFTVGECVEYGGRECTVLGMTLKTTKLGDIDDHSVITVCNRNISEIRRIADRLDVDFPLPYGEDARVAADAFGAVCEELTGENGIEKCSFLGIQEFAASAEIYRLRLFCDPTNRADARRAAIAAARRELTAAGIEIPFNQLDVHFDASERERP